MYVVVDLINVGFTEVVPTWFMYVLYVCYEGVMVVVGVVVGVAAHACLIL